MWTNIGLNGLNSITFYWKKDYIYNVLLYNLLKRKFLKLFSNTISKLTCTEFTIKEDVDFVVQRIFLENSFGKDWVITSGLIHNMFIQLIYNYISDFLSISFIKILYVRVYWRIKFKTFIPFCASGNTLYFKFDDLLSRLFLGFF